MALKKQRDSHYSATIFKGDSGQNEKIQIKLWSHLCLLTQRWQNSLFTSLTSENWAWVAQHPMWYLLAVIKDMALITQGSKGLLSSQIQRLRCSFLGSVDLWPTDRQNVIERNICVGVSCSQHNRHETKAGLGTKWNFQRHAPSDPFLPAEL